MKNILEFNIYRTVLAVVLLSLLSAWQRIEDVKTLMFIVSGYLVLVFLFSSFKIVRGWFSK